MTDRTYLLLLAAALLGLLLPAAWNVYGSTATFDWRTSSRFDRDAYLVSSRNFVPASADPSGVHAVIATLLSWSGAEASEETLLQQSTESGFSGNLADVTTLAASHGLDGQWLQANSAALSQLKLPFVAHMADGGGRVVLVRDVRSGYVYATDPRRGQVLYPLAQFSASWTGQVFAFPEPPAQPLEWR